MASHDLQEPLRMVASFVELLAKRYEGQLDEKADMYIGFAVEGATRMQALIQSLLAYSRVDSRGGEPEPIDPNRVVGEVLTGLQRLIQETGARGRRRRPAAGHGRPDAVQQLFQNLIENAVKFRAEAPPLVSISATTSGDMAEFILADNGIGMDPQYNERIFTVFQRLITRGAYPGTGIGLSICKRIVERHGGRIWVESELGKGRRSTSRCRSRPRTRPMTDAPRNRNVEILLVEDDRADVELTRQALTLGKLANTLHVARDGVEALAFLRRQGEPHLGAAPGPVLLDLGLPRKDGREVLAEMKADPDLRRIPVVVVTSSSDEGAIAEAYSLHANCCIAKPMQLDAFVDVVRQIEDFWLAIVTLPPQEK